VETRLDSKEKPPLSESRFVAGLEVTARAAAVFVAVVYGTGFLIVAIYHAQYGIAQFDFLKPKIVSTGIVFVLLTTLPTMAEESFLVASQKSDSDFRIGGCGNPGCRWSA
jgi:hypothetical protein